MAKWQDILRLQISLNALDIEWRKTAILKSVRTTEIHPVKSVDLEEVAFTSCSFGARSKIEQLFSVFAAFASNSRSTVEDLTKSFLAVG